MPAETSSKWNEIPAHRLTQHSLPQQKNEIEPIIIIFNIYVLHMYITLGMESHVPTHR